MLAYQVIARVKSGGGSWSWDAAASLSGKTDVQALQVVIAGIESWSGRRSSGWRWNAATSLAGKANVEAGDAVSRRRGQTRGRSRRRNAAACLPGKAKVVANDGRGTNLANEEERGENARERGCDGELHTSILVSRHRSALYSANQRCDGNREADKLHHCGLKLVIRLKAASQKRCLDTRIDV